MLTAQQLAAGLAYAQDNFENDAAPHLKVDKRIIKELLDLNGKNILDFGCGMGGMTLWYSKAWECNVYGLDIDKHHIAVAQALRQKWKAHNVQFVQRNLLAEPFSDTEKFDHVFMNDVVEHISFPILQKLFKSLRTSLNPGGRIFVSYPPWKSPHASHVDHVLRIPWCQFLPQKMLKKMIAKNNVQILGDLEPDLLSAYESLNRLDHAKFSKILDESGWKIELRKSYSLLNRIPGLWNTNIRIFPLNYLITKEFLILSPK